MVRSSTARRATAAAFLGALVIAAADVRADDLTMEQCVEANESAQVLRRDGKLRAARAQLRICLTKTCPGPVRDDCGERMTELDRSAPTVAFTAKGPAGNTLHAVQITMDGARLADHLDGSMLVVDPGEHLFVFAADGYTTVSKKLVLREGVKARQEVVTFQSTEPPPRAEPVALVAPRVVTKPDPSRSESYGGTQRTIAYVLGGAGVVSVGVGTYFGLHSKSTYDATNCPHGPSCSQEDVDNARSQADISTIAFVLGGALLASGVVLFFTAPKDGALSVQSSAGPSSAGVRLGASW